MSKLSAQERKDMYDSLNQMSQEQLRKYVSNFNKKAKIVGGHALPKQKLIIAILDKADEVSDLVGKLRRDKAAGKHSEGIDAPARKKPAVKRTGGGGTSRGAYTTLSDTTGKGQDFSTNYIRAKEGFLKGYAMQDKDGTPVVRENIKNNLPPKQTIARVAALEQKVMTGEIEKSSKTYQRIFDTSAKHGAKSNTYDTLRKAKMWCDALGDKCGGITQTGENKYELRRGGTLQENPKNKDGTTKGYKQRSWVKGDKIAN